MQRYYQDAITHSDTGFFRCTTQVRQQRNVIQIQKAGVYIGFAFEHIQPRARIQPSFNALIKALLSTNIATRSVD